MAAGKHPLTSASGETDQSQRSGKGQYEGRRATPGFVYHEAHIIILGFYTNFTD